VSCTESNSAVLAQIDGLHKLTIQDPSRAVLQILPKWLSKLSSSLVELHLRGNCGSITPGVLRSLVPHLQKVRSITLGLSYSLADEDVFSALGQLPHLESVGIQYYLQLKALPRIHLPNLRSLIVRHSRMQSGEDVNRLCTWIKHVISSTLTLQSLRLISDDLPDYCMPGISYDSLVDDLGNDHGDTLRFLHIKSSFIGIHALRDLCERCGNLEELEVSVGENALARFTDFTMNMRNLHTVSFNVHFAKRTQTEPSEGIKILEKGPPSLRRLAINRVWWEGSWQSERDLGVRFVVNKMEDRDLS